MGITKAFINKLTTKIYRIFEPLEGTRSYYDPESKGGQVRQRIEEKIAGLFPKNASSVRFTPNGGMIKLIVANSARWRFFEVIVANLGGGSTGRTPTKTPYEAAVTIEINYPPEQTINVTENGVTTSYAVADLKSDDDEQIDGLLRSGTIFTEAPAIGGEAVVKSLESAFDLGDTQRRHRYMVSFSRVW